MTVQRSVRQIMALASAGHLGQVLLSHDVCLKDHLRVNGGCGYTYLFEDFLPLLLEAGLDAAEVDQLVRDNPTRALCS
jgi:phosphotriesterase-related protein